ncbi:MAG: hypothetical protein ACO3N7_09505, partial [Kiritimatiellia bacterium]
MYTHRVAVKLNRKQLLWGERILAGVLVFAGAMLAADPVRSGLGLWFGGMWIYLAIHFRLPPLLLSLLVWMALRSPVSSGLAAGWFLSVNLGLTAFCVAQQLKGKYFAPFVALCWAGVAWISPPLSLWTVAGLPRFSRMYGEERKWFLYPALLLILGIFVLFFFQGIWTDLIHRPFEQETYTQLRQAFLSLFSTESLWRWIPVVGVFEITQKQADEHKV